MNTPQTAVVTAKPGEALPATVDPNQLPAELVGMATEDAGKGVSTTAADNIVPMIYVLQPLSPQVDDASPARITGAKPGGIWLRNSSIGVVDAAEGFIFQPCHFEKAWPEWGAPHGKRGGGFVARHKNKEATAEDVAAINARHRGPGTVETGEDIPDVGGADYVIHPKHKNKIWFRGNSAETANALVLTRNHAGYVVVGDNQVLPYVLPLTGSGHGVSKNWMFSMMSRRLPNGGIEPSWLSLYRLRARQRRNNDGTWWQLEPDRIGYVDAVGYRRGKDLHAAFESGEKVAEAEVGGVADDTPAGGVSSSGGAPAGRRDEMDDEVPF